MIVALAVLLVPIVLVTWWFTRVPAEPPVRALDWAALADQGSVQSPYRLARPTSLPDTWTCTRARWTRAGDPGIDGKPVSGNTWQLGFLTPDRVYLALDQRDAGAADLIAVASRGGVADGQQQIAGRPWTRLVSPDGRTRALASTVGPVTTVVSGDLPVGALVAFVETLAP